jgi:hypothetical protein
MTWRGLTQQIRLRWRKWPHFLNNFTNRALPADVNQEEELSTFVVHRSKVNKETLFVREQLFLPRPGKSDRIETSVNRTSCLMRRTIWAICKKHFDIHQKTPAIGRGRGPASAVLQQNLSFDADGDPHPTHANIIGWYANSGKTLKELEKHHWKFVAQKIAAKFRYVERPK